MDDTKYTLVILGGTRYNNGTVNLLMHLWIKTSKVCFEVVPEVKVWVGNRAE